MNGGAEVFFVILFYSIFFYLKIMLHILWNKGFSVGVEEFDAQHKQIFKIIDSLKGTGEDSRQEPAMDLRDTMLKLQEYASNHLDEEERYFEKYDYPRKKKHIRIHNKYRKKVADLVEAFNNGENIIPELVKFLEKWWVKHINKEDKKYTKFFNDLGVF